MNKIEEILNKRIILYTSPIKEEVVEAMNEFGRLAFEAGRDQYWDDGGTGCLEFKHDDYEDFLKEIEDENI